MGYRDEAGDTLRSLLRWFQQAPHPSADFAGIDAAMDAGRQAPGPSVHPDADVAGFNVPRNDRAVDLPAAVPAGVAAAGTAAGLGALGAMRAGRQAVTPGGEAELAAEIPPLVVEPEPEVGAPMPAAKPARQQDDLDRLRAARANLPQVLDPRVANRMAADQILAGYQPFAEYDARIARRDAMDRQAYQAGTDRMEQAYEREKASYDENGRPRLPVDNVTPAGRNMKIDPITGRPVNMSDREIEAQARADMRSWGDEVPGSDNQRRYNPQGAAQWDRQVADKISEDAQNELAISASPFASQMRKDSESRQAEVNKNTRQKIYEARANPLARNQMSDDELAGRDAVVRRAQARSNPLEYLGRGDINDWQRMVAADSMLRGGAGPMTPLGVQATHNQQLTELGQRVAQGLGFGALGNPDAQDAAIAALPAEQRARASVRKKEPIGEGHSAEHVADRWDYWMNGAGPSSPDEREAGFRRDMRRLGYRTEQINSYIQANKGTGGRPAAENVPDVEIGTSPGVGF